MTEQHKAAPKQWAETLKWNRHGSHFADCILELRARVEALEAAQHARVDASRPGKWDHLKISVETTYGVESTQAEQLMRSRTFTADEVAPIVTSAAPAGSLVERVAAAPNDRAKIREVAAWLRSEYPRREGYGTAWANLIEEEADR